MQKLLLTAAAALAIAGFPILSQATTVPPNHENSHVGAAGKPGSESGMATNQNGLSAPPAAQNSRTKPLRDTAKIPAKPGAEAGPATGPSSGSASK